MADTLKNLRRQADMGIRKVKGSAGGIGDEVGVTGLPDQLSRYEHLIGIVQSISKDMRLIVSGQLSLAQQGHDLEMKVRQIGQVLNLAGPETVTVIDVEVLPPFTAGGSSLNSHATAIQSNFLPCLDRLVSTQKGLTKDISDYKRLKLDYEHYVLKVQDLEEGHKKKWGQKEMEKLESNKQKLEQALSVYESNSRDLNKKISNATLDVALEIGLALSGLSSAMGSVIANESEQLNLLQQRGPGWLTAAPASSTDMISVSQPDKNPISNKLPFKISFNKKDQQPRALALPPASMAPSTFPAIRASDGGMDIDELRAKLADAEERNEAGAAAYHKLRGDLETAMEKLRAAEKLQQATEEQLKQARMQLDAATGRQGVRGQADEEVMELRRRLQQAEQNEQAYQIRLSSLNKQLEEARGSVAPNQAPGNAFAASAFLSPPIQEVGVWNPFGGGGNSPADSHAKEALPVTSSQLPRPVSFTTMAESSASPQPAASSQASSAPWNPFG